MDLPERKQSVQRAREDGRPLASVFVRGLQHLPQAVKNAPGWRLFSFGSARLCLY